MCVIYIKLFYLPVTLGEFNSTKHSGGKDSASESLHDKHSVDPYCKL